MNYVETSEKARNLLSPGCGEKMKSFEFSEKQLGKVKDIKSWTCTVEVGAPRRSTFAPIFFSLEAIELPLVSEEQKFQIFAYGTTNVHHDKSESEINQRLEHIPSWLF